ncbi:CheR family methyltransferase [Halothermothrix orenii]|uniref:Protein-glutamate O-methyltransferase n=1 Tax=Halothermothrix orenii (strain H 168 / OCM 544 / DSM 9562) TaxID=373903 RepID=B8CZS1_HALOH|nr:protein-glutamate O-methyltransferase CheR [Halothermothrix orenii]ACL70773.1 Protein-glutamate O-methyltransferase [Halothermothrix orenii H 168]
MGLSFNEFKDEAIKILNIDLDSYKIKRVKRRTDSLMRRHNIKTYDDCLELIKRDTDFRAAYLNHFTINTSEFFRNPENFDYLRDKVLPGLFNKQEKVKIWSAPCSNGAEPYSIAIILEEMNIKPHRYEILASDIDPDILEMARTGIYSNNILQNVSPELLKKYFSPVQKNSNSKYQLTKDIINRVTFERKDLLKENYSSDWDLILSRNFFIYLTREVKERLTRKFTMALKPGGYLFLGNTEFIFDPRRYGLTKLYSSFYKKED